MGFRYTAIGALMNEDKFDEAAEALVELLVSAEVERAEKAEQPIEAQTNKAAVARVLNVNYRTMSRWVASLRDKGHDVEKQARAKLAVIAKEQKRAA